jgi:hypothetical protein
MLDDIECVFANIEGELKSIFEFRIEVDNLAILQNLLFT